MSKDMGGHDLLSFARLVQLQAPGGPAFAQTERLVKRHTTLAPKRRRRRRHLSYISADLVDRGAHDTSLSRIPSLQNALDLAVQAERYHDAAGLRDELESAKNSDSLLLLSANIRYYQAFNTHNTTQIAALWENSPYVSCQHPFSPCCVGYTDVVASFDVLFATLPDDLQLMISDVRIAPYGALAYVTCIETPQTRSYRAGQGRGVRQHGLRATTIFTRRPPEEGDGFLMVHHCSTPIVKELAAL